MSQTRYEAVGDVAVVTMVNPPASLFTLEIAEGLLGSVQRAMTENKRAMVLQTDGAVFSGGADASMFHNAGAEQVRVMFDVGMRMVAALEDAPFPVIASVHGRCFAAGLEVALASDLIIAAEGTQFGQVEALIGATTFLGGVYRLAERCGPARAREITYGGGTYSAETFERWNIINRIVPAGELREQALAWAQKLAKGPTAAHTATKRLLRHALDHGSRQADRYMPETASSLFATRDLQHAVGLLLSEGAQKFRANHDEVVFEGR